MYRIVSVTCIPQWFVLDSRRAGKRHLPHQNIEAACIVCQFVATCSNVRSSPGSVCCTKCNTVSTQLLFVLISVMQQIIVTEDRHCLPACLPVCLSICNTHFHKSSLQLIGVPITCLPV